ncbi:helix-turn-helix domain-containing protein [Clostridium manihotivorum]|uniref:AraC family transcriptional regulator n=1 Tax=Clostridium manihotivorum TaxID=2320868 RepID=A0A410DZL8_9CLOT|nr:AraC family transcriptional regulator [Clostridium manihotivorum]QAA34539.1 AraC family transcriptional regulator [Clostridium manihotivorum]
MKYLKADISSPLIFSNCGNFTSDSKWLHMERTIDNYELIIMNKGTMYIEQDDEKYELKEGELLLLEPYRNHKGYDYSEKGTSFFWLHFYCNDDCTLYNHEEAMTEISMAKSNPYFNGLNSSVLIPTISRNLNLDRINVLFRQLMHLSQSTYYTSHSVNYNLTSLLIEVTEQVLLNFDSSVKNAKDEDILPEILQWIKIHITQNISLQNVSYEFNFSKEYLARYFKKRMGMSMQQYINNLRISKAKQLLCNSSLNIKEIAEELGFIDEKYFLKLFKKYENLTPKQFRNAYNMTFINNV